MNESNNGENELKKICDVGYVGEKESDGFRIHREN